MASILLKSILRSLKPTETKISLNQTRFKSNTYKAAFLKQTKVPLVIETKERVNLEKHQVRVQVQYCSVNSVDCAGFRDGSKEKEYPFIPGYELAGEVLELGRGIINEQLIKGERVAALSLDKFGGFAEECIVNLNDCWRIPTNVETKEAAVLICGHTTAIYTFSKMCQVKEHDNIMITIGPAGLGLAAVDVAANMYKANVIAITDTEDRTELVRDRGAFQTIKCHEELPKEIYSITDNRGMDIVYDAVGENMFETVGKCVATNGKIFHAAPVVYRTIPAPPANTTLTLVSFHLLRRQNASLYRTLVEDTLQLANDEIISAHISAQFPLRDVNKAIEYIERRECTGKVLIEIDG